MTETRSNIDVLISIHPLYASKIIEGLKTVELRRKFPELADAETIIKNQYLLIEEFWKDVQKYQHSFVIFDGHSVIDTSNALIAVPTDVIKALKPCKIIFVNDDPQYIHSRRKSDTARERSDASVEQIKEEQDKAIEQAKHYAAILEVPITNIKSGDLEMLRISIL